MPFARSWLQIHSPYKYKVSQGDTPVWPEVNSRRGPQHNPLNFNQPKTCSTPHKGHTAILARLAAARPLEEDCMGVGQMPTQQSSLCCCCTSATTAALRLKQPQGALHHSG